MAITTGHNFSPGSSDAAQGPALSGPAGSSCPGTTQWSVQQSNVPCYLVGRRSASSPLQRVAKKRASEHENRDHWTFWTSSGTANSAQFRADLKLRVDSIVHTEDGLVPLDLTDPSGWGALLGPAGAAIGNKGVVVGFDGSLRKDGAMGAEVGVPDSLKSSHIEGNRTTNLPTPSRS